jgi:hypothetical protein
VNDGSSGLIERSGCHCDNLGVIIRVDNLGVNWRS